MGSNEFINLQGTWAGEPHLDCRDETEGVIPRVPGVPESVRFGWESAWIDIGGEG